MRHFLASRAVAALALRVRQAPRKARLVARAGCPQRGRAGTLGAAGGAIALPPITVAADQHCRAARGTEIASSGRLHGPWGRWETRRQRPLRERLRAQRPRRLARVWGATLGMTWRFEPVSRLRCHRPSPIVRASATRVPNALPPDCTNTPPPAIGAPGSGACPVALRAPSNAPDPIKQTAAIRSPDQGHAVPCRRWTPDVCGNRPPLTPSTGPSPAGAIWPCTTPDTCCSATPARYLVLKNATSRFLSTSRSPPWRIAKPAVSQMPGVLESDRVSGKHDVAFDGRVSQRSRTRVLPTYEAGPWTVCSRLAGRARQSGRGGK